MGAGSFGAGEGAAGEDIPTPPDAPRNVTPPAALLFDGRTRDFPLNAQGRYRRVHPVDQRVALALLIAYGTIASAPTVGDKVRRITKIVKSTPGQVAGFVNEALDTMLRAGDIVLRDVQIETNRVNGTILLAVSYTNLRIQPPTNTTTRVNLNGA